MLRSTEPQSIQAFTSLELLFYTLSLQLPRGGLSNGDCSNNAFDTIAPPMLLLAGIGGVATLIARRKK